VKTCTNSRAIRAVACQSIGHSVKSTPPHAAAQGGMVPDENPISPMNALKESIETGKVPGDELLDDL